MDTLQQKEKILLVLGWDDNSVLKTARSNSPAITANQFISALIENTTVVGTAKSTELWYSDT